MAELSVIEKNGVEYALKDKTAREAIEKIQQNGTGDSGGNADYGAENAGKLLYVGADGFATVLTLGAGLAIVNGVLTITSQQVIAAICGESTICGNTICGGA